MRSKRNRHKSRRKRGRGANKKIVRKRKTERGRRRAAQRRARVPPFAPVSFTKEQPPSTAVQQLSPEEQRFEVYRRGAANPFPAGHAARVRGVARSALPGRLPGVVLPTGPGAEHVLDGLHRRL